jgi:hypothetical protein
VTILIINPSFEDFAQDRFTCDPAFTLLRIIPFAISVVWLGIGVKQWFVLSKWTKRFQRYKEAQKELDRKLGEGNVPESND